MRRSRSSPRIALPVVVLAVGMIGLAVWTAVRGGDDEGEPAGSNGARLERRGSEERTGDPLTIDDGGEPAGGTGTRLERRGSEERVGDPLVIGDGAAAYTVTYALRLPGRPDTTETIAVVRPYRSRRSAPTEVTVTDFTRLQVTPSKGAVSVLSPPPAAVDPR
ncbi:MAG: hypothetical protein M3Q68_06400, partial [Actinomycetota bacterium]|nr:hypothetical protein [Actinomycetota bacterium]